ncbi:RF-1 domain-containing protein [Collybia nuda]|uniref:RF-1 domain-containing protein n=1 Tax=Collybia nuda TaxID=64659 RepID=A0A9P5YAF4_9AGAR|nr:RF-1 domain-containing protein [Collybia nuda]
MSITPALKAFARSAYRDLWRASSGTFAGDDEVLKAFRSKMRMDAVAAQTVFDPEAYQEQAKLAMEIADVLRKNIVQAARVSEVSEHGADKETWRLRITKDTELGSNETIKNPPLVEKSNAAPHSGSYPQFLVHAPSLDKIPSMNYSALKRAHKERVIPELREEDLEESFVRGEVINGGQSINKTENNVQLLHRPSGIRVSCQDTRSLSLNRRLARRLILDKLDKLMNPGLSKDEFLRAKQRERERRRRKKAKKKALEQNIEESEPPLVGDE